MKKIIAITSILFLGYTSFGQSTALFENGTNVINAGVGLGGLYWAGTGTSGVPISFYASYDRGVTQKLGIGYIGAGGEFGYTSAKYAGGFTATGVLIRARASYHFSLGGDIGEKLDPYAGVSLGYVITSYSSGYGGGKANALAAGGFAGAHYYFTQNFGAFAEFSSSFTLFNTGLTFKF
jgi:hypothetical protein